MFLKLQSQMGSFMSKNMKICLKSWNTTYFVGTFTLLIALLLPANAMALQSIGDVAENLMGPTSIATKLVDITCYIIGFAFVLMAFAQYKIHLQSPKLVPLMTPVLLLVLGVCALMIPYVTKHSDTGKSKTQETQTEKSNLLPLPDLQQNTGPGVPYPPYGNTSGASDSSQNMSPPPPSDQTPPPSDQNAAPAANEPPPSSGGGHWTQEPRYNQ